MIIGAGIILDLVFIKNEKIFNKIGLVGMILSISGLSTILISTLIVFFMNINLDPVILRSYYGFYYCIITVVVIVIERYLNYRMNGKPEIKEEIRSKKSNIMFKLIIVITGSLASVFLLLYEREMELYFLISLIVVFSIGLFLNLSSLIRGEISKYLGAIGTIIFIGGFLLNWIYIGFLLTERAATIYTLGICFGITTCAVLVCERFWNLKIIASDTTHYEKPVVKIEKVIEKVPKSKGFLKKGLKGVTKQVGKMAGDMVGDLVEDKLAKVTGDEDLAGIVGGITDKGVSALTGKGLSKLAEKAISPTKPKGLLKKGLKGVTKKAGKIAGDMVGDAISDMTGNEKIGDLAGKFAKKGVSKLVDVGVGAVSEPRKIPSSSQVSPEPIKVNYKKRLLGIIKAKKQVEIPYISNILKLSGNEIIGMIYELIGKEKIKGSFNEDDTEFTLE